MSFQRKRENLRDRPRVSSLIGQNTKLARKSWEITAEQVRVLKTLTQEFRLSVALGDLKLLDSRWYVTHSGLLRLAKRNRCAGIQVRPMREFSDPATDRWVFRAVVHKVPYIETVRRLRRRRSIKHFTSRSRRRNARGRNTSRQPRSPQGLWNRPLLCRGIGRAYRFLKAQ